MYARSVHLVRPQGGRKGVTMGIQEDGSARWCEVCDKQFVAFSPRAQYCSQACKQKAWRLKKSGHSNTNRSPGRPVHKVTCRHCGRKFNARRTDAKFCSQSCRTLANRARHHETYLMFKRETLFDAYDFFSTVDRNGWEFMYKQIEEWGYVWIESKEQYWRKGMAEACRLI